MRPPFTVVVHTVGTPSSVDQRETFQSPTRAWTRALELARALMPAGGAIHRPEGGTYLVLDAPVELFLAEPGHLVATVTVTLAA
jgi:hypothetical protein